MGFHFQKRISIGKGLHINISKSGISPSIRTKFGSISRKGASLRTGISGVSYRKNFSEAKNKGCALVLILPTLLLIVLKLIFN